MRTMLVVLVMGVGSAAVMAQRQPAPPPNPLSLIPSFVCSFPKHAATEWGVSGPATVLGEESFSFEITSINLRRSAALIVGSGGGKAEVTAILTQTGLNVIEQTGYGNFILTTVFAAGAENRAFKAVHSRHLGDLKTMPSVSQHVGTCEPGKPAA